MQTRDFVKTIKSEPVVISIKKQHVVTVLEMLALAAIGLTFAVMFVNGAF